MWEKKKYFRFYLDNWGQNIHTCIMQLNFRNCHKIFIAAQRKHSMPLHGFQGDKVWVMLSEQAPMIQDEMLCLWIVTATDAAEKLQYNINKTNVSLL